MSILETRRPTIVREWVTRLHASSPRYGQRSTKELEQTVGGLLDGIIEILKTGDRKKTVEAITSIAKLRTRQGFTLGETQRAFYIGLDTMMSAAHLDFGPENADQCLVEIRRLMELVHWALETYSDAFVDMISKEFSATAIVALCAAQEGFDESDILRRSIQRCCRILDYDSGAVFSIDGRTGRVELAAHCGLDEGLIGTIRDIIATRTDGIGAAIAADKKPRLIENDPDRVGVETGLPASSGIRTVMGVPIVARGVLTGIALLGSRTSIEVYPYDITFMVAMANQIGLACESARLFRETQRFVGQLTLQYDEVSTMLSELEAAMYVADMDTYEVLATNTYLEKILGPNLKSKKCYEVFQKDQTAPCPFCTNKYLVVNGKPAPPYVWKFQNTATGRWFRCIDRAIRWPDGRLVRMEVAVDITDLEISREQLEETHRTLELLNDLMVHDVGNCADAVRGCLELLEEESGPANKQKEMLHTALAQAKEARRVIDNVAKLVKIKAGGETLMTTQDIVALAEDAIEDVRRMEEGKKLDVRYDMRRGKCFAKLGPFAPDIFVNVLSNAAKFGRGMPVEVSISDSDIGDKAAWKVTITDQGKGIPPEKRKVVFERFERLDELKRSKGMGLGLALVKSLVERYDGRIDIEDRVPGDYKQGTSFSVVLPKAAKGEHPTSLGKT